MTIDEAVKKFRQFYIHQNRLPSYQEQADIFGMTKKGAYKWAVKLIDRGILGKDEKGKLFPKSLFLVPHLGIIKAGSPMPASDMSHDFVDFYAYFLGMPQDVFCLTVKGDSMIDEGINEGDLAVIEKGKRPQEGDIVAATVDGECTLKILRKKDGQYYLSPANKKYNDIYPLTNMHIDGVVINVIRKYH